MSPTLIAAQTAVVGALAGAYALRARRLARGAHPVPRLRLVCVAAGLTVLLASMVVLRQPGRELLFWHTLERLLVGDLGCLLIAIGLTDAMLAPLSRTPLRHLRMITRPPVALALWIANLLLWQWPSIFDATLRHDSLTLAMNVVSIAVGLNMWCAVLSALAAARSRVSYRDRVAFTLVGRIVGVALASVAIWSPDVYYPYFMRADTASSVSPLADQGIAGAIMLTEMVLVAIGLLLWMSARLAAQAPAAAQASITAPTPAAAPARRAPAHPGQATEPAHAAGSALAVDSQQA
jgi:cytochrome c oxidase assembly factor CtaG